MAAHIFNVPIALVNFVYEKNVKSESSVGMEGGYDFSREVAICSQAVLMDKVTVFRNARMEPCLAANPFVCGDFGLQFYAAAPLKTKDGFNIGVVVIVDQKPRTFSKEDEQILDSLAAIVMEELEMIKLLRSENDCIKLAEATNLLN